MIQEKLTLKIARYLLEGKLVKLQKPLADLLRNNGADPVSFDMVAIVKQRLVSQSGQCLSLAYLLSHYSLVAMMGMRLQRRGAR